MSSVSFAIVTEVFLILSFTFLINLYLKNNPAKKQLQNCKTDLNQIKRQVTDRKT